MRKRKDSPWENYHNLMENYYYLMVNCHNLVEDLQIKLMGHIYKDYNAHGYKQQSYRELSQL